MFLLWFSVFFRDVFVFVHGVRLFFAWCCVANQRAQYSRREQDLRIYAKKAANLSPKQMIFGAFCAKKVITVFFFEASCLNNCSPEEKKKKKQKNQKEKKKTERGRNKKPSSSERTKNKKQKQKQNQKIKTKTKEKSKPENHSNLILDIDINSFFV